MWRVTRLCLSRLCNVRGLCSGAEEMGKKGTFFYAVRKGLQPGVYNTWDECKSQVDKFPCASYKKFGSEKDAWEFVRSQPTKCSSVKEETSSCDIELPKRAPSYEATMAAVMGGLKRKLGNVNEEEEKKVEGDEVDGCAVKRVKVAEDKPQNVSPAPAEKTDFTYMGDAVVVYTDGCCEGNGRPGARAGIGVYWGPNHPLNVADRLGGRQTNQRAELQAACKALEQARDLKIKKLVLYTDSKFTINGVTSWVKKWKLNGWRLKGGGKITNQEDFERLDALNQELQVVWQHIPGHAGFAGNEEADRLSRLGAAKTLE
ncbi:ribonuclease H1 isoform X2 [Alosa pseudoharengus]|uniref:ribonuclease H1 isoform X2 n=1 Tax=Alosa sapidissima TaxID=34773 RepID=UPI001C09D5F7|nr:ribonuclease H1 isoform X2 [Alosa sapidissima]XP_048106368.1 ribonuclease H1 isoform X2 [Alosa alosa]